MEYSAETNQDPDLQKLLEVIGAQNDTDATNTGLAILLKIIKG